MTGLASSMLKKSPFSPARPRRVETHLFPSGVLASLRGSMYRSVRFASSLVTALPDSLFEHPVWSAPVAQDVWTIECPGVSEIVFPQLATGIQAGHRTEMPG